MLLLVKITTKCCYQWMVLTLDNHGWAPLHAAVHWGNTDPAELLVEKGNIDAST